MHFPKANKLFKLRHIQKALIPALLCSSVVILTTGCSSSAPQNITNEPVPVVKSTLSDQEFFAQRDALIIKHSHHDKTFAALKAQVKPNDSESSEYWRWRIDQYLYGHYPEYQPIYDAYKQGKSFHDIYNLPPEQLGPKKPLPSTLPKLPDGYFSDNLQGNPHTGEYYIVGDKVYIVYQGKLTDPYIASYDLKTQQWDGPYKAAESTLSKGDRKIDSHGRPIIERDAKGHFHIVFGGHGGEREDGLNPMSYDTPHAGGRMLHYMSEKPNDISSFVHVDDITPFASYTASHTMPNGDVYLFTRAGTHKSPWLMYKMKSGSQRFEKPVAFTWPTPNLDDPIQVDTHYIKTKVISDTEIAISYLWHTCNFLEYHDKTSYGRHNVYYMTYDTTTGNFYNVEKEKLTLPITIPMSQTKTLAYDSVKAKEISFGTEPLVLKDGKPAVAYIARGPGYREWRMTSYDNGKWTHSQPMPGTEKRALTDESGKKVPNILSLEVIGSGDNAKKAVVIYKNKKGVPVFASATRKTATSTNWQVEKQYASLSKAKMEMKPVRDASGEVVSVILNIRKGAAQRLYLWQDGEFHSTH